MNKDLCNKVGEIGQDNLIYAVLPPAHEFGVTIPAGAGELKRGTVLACVDGEYAILSAENTGKAKCVLSVDVNATEDDVVAAAYRTGHLNRKALIVAEGYTMTAADEEELEKYGIFLSDMAQ